VWAVAVTDSRFLLVVFDRHFALLLGLVEV
jgi:hypothetical protein